MNSEAHDRAETGCDAIRFPKLYAALKWMIIGSLVVLAIAAAAFWSMILGRFAGSGFHAGKRAGDAGERIVITPECAWPYSVYEPEAESVCRMFYNMTPEEQAQALRARK